MRRDLEALRALFSCQIARRPEHSGRVQNRHSQEITRSLLRLGGELLAVPIAATAGRGTESGHRAREWMVLPRNQKHNVVSPLACNLLIVLRRHENF
jgi:hypothetical protein